MKIGKQISGQQAAKTSSELPRKASVLPLQHSFTIEPVTQARMKLLWAREHPGHYADEPIPDHIRSAVRITEEAEGIALLQGSKDAYWMPTPVARPNWFALSRGYAQRMIAKYKSPGFVEIQQGDTVVDCGAFVGGFAVGAAGRGGKVIAVEPTPLNYTCLVKNTAGTDIICHNAGLFDTDGQADFVIRENATDNSMLIEEESVEIERHTCPVWTIQTLMENEGLNHIDFLKVEAEGVELEILANVTPDIVSKIAVDAGPERYNQSPFLDIAVLLASRGYRLANRNYWLYATCSA